MNTIRTVLRTFNFDTRNPAENAAWQGLKTQLSATHPRCMESSGGNSHFLGSRFNGLSIELETAHVFDNQWNSAPIVGLSQEGYRLFDWALDACVGDTPKTRKRGHWLEQTVEMLEIRRNTYTCGYCGHQEPAQKGNVFCPRCIGSEYLKESDLHLLRMVPAGESFGAKRAPLSDAEKAHLLPLYLHAQIYGNTERDMARIASARAAISARVEKAIADATAERDGFLWLLNRGYKTPNVIFNSHAGRFSFGWRQALSGDVLTQTQSIMAGFPFPFEIVCADGRKLQGE